MRSRPLHRLPASAARGNTSGNPRVSSGPVSIPAPRTLTRATASPNVSPWGHVGVLTFGKVSFEGCINRRKFGKTDIRSGRARRVRISRVSPPPTVPTTPYTEYPTHRPSPLSIAQVARHIFRIRGWRNTGEDSRDARKKPEKNRTFGRLFGGVPVARGVP